MGRLRSIVRPVAAYLLAVLAASLTFWTLLFALMSMQPVPDDAPFTLHQALLIVAFIPVYGVTMYPLVFIVTLPAGLAALFMVVRLELKNPFVFGLLGCACAVSVLLIRPVDRSNAGEFLHHPAMLMTFLLPGIVGGLVFRLVYLWNRPPGSRNGPRGGPDKDLAPPSAQLGAPQ